MADYEPENGTVRAFEEVHPKGNGEPVQVDDLVRIPGSDKRWIVTKIVNDFAQLALATDGKQTFAYRRTRLERIER